MKREFYVAMSINGSNAWISASIEKEIPDMFERLGEGTILRFEDLPYTFEVARWESHGQWEKKTKLHIVELNDVARATNGLAAVVNDPQKIVDTFNTLVNEGGWTLVQYENFIEYHGLNH